METTMLSQAVKLEAGILFCQLKNKNTIVWVSGSPIITNFSVLPRMSIDESIKLHQIF